MQQHITAVDRKAVTDYQRPELAQCSVAKAPSYQTTRPSHFGSDHFELAYYISLHLAGKTWCCKKELTSYNRKATSEQQDAFYRLNYEVIV